MSFQIFIHTPGSHSKSVLPMLLDYEKRISRFAKLSWKITPTGSKEKENHALRKSIGAEPYIVLDERGKNITTLDISNLFSKNMQSGNPSLHIVIGGAYGLEQDLIKNALSSWAFGHITLPHQLVRLILAEQCYRALTVINNHPYHHQ